MLQYVYINHSAPLGNCCYNMPSGVQKDRTRTIKNASLKDEATHTQKNNNNWKHLEMQEIGGD